MSPRGNYQKGYYEVKNPSKYIGNGRPIFRSSWEFRVMTRFDDSDNIVKWGSESIAIPYIDPNTMKRRRYYIDFVIVLKNKKKYLIEVKPNRQTKPPRKSKNKKQSTYLYEKKMYDTNTAKWAYAKKFCEARGWEFKILTEKNFNF